MQNGTKFPVNLNFIFLFFCHAEMKLIYIDNFETTVEQ